MTISHMMGESKMASIRSTAGGQHNTQRQTDRQTDRHTDTRTHTESPIHDTVNTCIAVDLADQAPAFMKYVAYVR